MPRQHHPKTVRSGSPERKRTHFPKRGNIRRLETAREDVEHFRRALKNSPIILFNQDLELRYTWIFNPALGFNPETVIGRTDVDLLPMEDATRLTAIKQQVIETGIATREEVCITLDGKTSFYDLTVEPMQDASGKIIGITCATTDITKLKHAEEAMCAQYKGIPLPTYTWRRQGDDFVLIDYNDAADEITRGDVANLLGNTSKELFPDKPEILEDLRRCFTDRRTIRRQGQLRLRSIDEERDFDVTYVYVPPDLVMVHAEDITERLCTEVRLTVRERQQAVVAELGQQALAGGKLDELMDALVTKVAHVLGVEYCKILELLPDNKLFRLRAGVGWKKGLVGRAQVDTGANSQAGYTLSTKEPVIVEDLRKETRFRGPPLLQDHGVVSGMSVIIQGTDWPYGILGVHTRTHRLFTLDDVHFLQAVANVLAEAIKRQHVQDALKQTSNELEQRVRERTTKLLRTNEALRIEADARLQAQKALELERDFAKGLIETAPAIVLVLDDQGRIVSFNPYMETLSGYALDEVKGKDWFTTFLPARDHKRIKTVFSKAISGEKTQGNVNPIVTKSGEQRLIEWYDTNLYDADDCVTGVLAIGQDITERKKLEEQAHQRLQQLTLVERHGTLNELASGLAHELNQPLTAILNYSQECLRQMQADGNDPRLVTAMEQVIAQAKRAAEIIKHIRGFISNGLPQRAEADINRLVTQAAVLIESEARGHGVQIRLALTENLPPVYVDDIQIEQVILNLLRNSLEAMAGIQPDKLEVVIHTDLTDKNEIEVSVQDNGPGMSPEMAKRLFEPFVTTKRGGMGLGLSISRTIVEAHGGSLTVNPNPVRGVTFRFTLPLENQNHEA